MKSKQIARVGLMVLLVGAGLMYTPVILMAFGGTGAAIGYLLAAGMVVVFGGLAVVMAAVWKALD